MKIAKLWLACGLAAGCTPPVAPPMATSCPRVPPKPVSTVPDPLPPASPVPQMLTPGHWEWEGTSYSWAPPQWAAQMNRVRPLWQDGYWTPDSGGCEWHSPHWVPGGTAPGLRQAVSR